MIFFPIRGIVLAVLTIHPRHNVMQLSIVLAPCGPCLNTYSCSSTESLICVQHAMHIVFLRFSLDKMYRLLGL